MILPLMLVLAFLAFRLARPADVSLNLHNRALHPQTGALQPSKRG